MKKILKGIKTAASYVVGAGMAAAWFVSMKLKGKNKW
jgi:hypothetical protein